MIRRKALVVLSLFAGAGFVVAALVLGAYRIYEWRGAPGAPPPLVRLDAGTLREFKDAFNAADDRTRLVALLSPT